MPYLIVYYHTFHCINFIILWWTIQGALDDKGFYLVCMSPYRNSPVTIQYHSEYYISQRDPSASPPLSCRGASRYLYHNKSTTACHGYIHREHLLNATHAHAHGACRTLTYMTMIKIHRSLGPLIILDVQEQQKQHMITQYDRPTVVFSNPSSSPFFLRSNSSLCMLVVFLFICTKNSQRDRL